MLWIYLEFSDLLLESCGAEQTEPVVIVSQVDNRVVQLNAMAIKYGIRRNMKLATAALMCQSLVVLPYNEEAEAQQLQQLADWLYLVTSDICLFKPKGLLLRVTPMLSLHGGLVNYWQLISKHIHTRGINFSFGCGYSALAAKLLAQQQSNRLTDDKKMIDKGYQNIIYIESSNALGNDFEGTVDAVHFTDLGFLRYSAFLIQKFKEYNLIND